MDVVGDGRGYVEAVPVKRWGTYLNREFSKEELQMAKRHLRNCSTSLAIKEMQIKTTLRYYLLPVRIGKLENTNDSLCWRECRIRGTLLHCWWECKHVQLLWKLVWQFPKKLGNEYHRIIPLKR